MDVGNPSNLERIQYLYNFDLLQIQKDISSFSFNDEETLSAIKDLFLKYNYIIDPHGAVGYLALKKYFENNPNPKRIGIVAETAHASKFLDIVENAINNKVEIPNRLKIVLEKEKRSIKLDNKFNSLKEFLLQ
jgi:threonine synthase